MLQSRAQAASESRARGNQTGGARAETASAHRPEALRMAEKQRKQAKEAREAAKIKAAELKKQEKARKLIRYDDGRVVDGVA